MSAELLPLLHLTPEGVLVLTPEGLAETDEVPGKLEKALRAADADEGSPTAALLTLAGEDADGDLPADLAWWRHLVREFIMQFCQVPGLREGAWQTPVATPASALMEKWIQEAPPVHGMEYLSPERLAVLWQALHGTLAARIVAAGSDVEAVLRELHPVWRMVGRVTLHLAENKRDPQRPFAFIATYTHRVNARSEPQHLPLARALQDSAGRNDRSALQTLLEPLNAASKRSALVQQLIASKRVFQALAWEPAEAFAFLQEIPVFEESGLLVKVPDWWQGRRPPSPQVQVTLDAGDKQSTVGAQVLLSFNVNVALGGEPLTREEIAKILASDAPLISLRGKWIEPDRERLQQALNHWHRAEAANRDGVPFHEGLRWLAGWNGGAAAVTEGLTLDDTGGLANFIAGDSLRKLLGDMRAETDSAGSKPPAGLKATLRHYQQRGLDWLDFMGRLGCGACLADDMGLGKTLQLIALVLRRREARVKAKQPLAPSLVVAPASLLANWEREFRKFAPEVPVVIAHRSSLSAGELAKVEVGEHPAMKQGGVFLTTYTTLGKLAGFNEITWDLAVLDEAQAIKNAGSSQARTVKKLQGTLRIALTGTPVENRLGDLWSLFDFLNPGLLGSAGSFAARARQMSKAGSGYAPLRKLVRPFILRRVKTDPAIAPDLPRKTEMTAFCSLSKRQAQLYQRLVTALARELGDTEDQIQRQGVILAALMKLKQICNHPSQWSGDSRYLPADSGKFQRLEELCSGIADRQEKVIVFTQFKEMTLPVADYLATVFGRPGLVLHGGTAVGKRGQLVEEFQSPGGPPFFVISVKAGGTGLTLTAASHVIHFDRWWNPAVEDQATDRAYRIGQTKAVMVHKFVCQGTLEEKIDGIIREKRGLAQEILGGDGDGAVKLLTEMNDKDLVEFLQFRAMGAE